MSEEVAKAPATMADRLERAINMGVCLDTREVFMVGGIGPEEDTGVDWLLPALRYLDRESRDPITLWLYTPGGDVSEMFAIYDAMRLMRCPVRTVAVGEVCSAGVLLLVAGTKGYRFATESAVLMSHEPEANLGEGGLRAQKDRAKWLEWTNSHWCELMARHTAQDAAWWKRKTDRQAEYWLLGGQEMRDAGMVDALLASPDDLTRLEPIRAAEADLDGPVTGS